MQARLRAGLEPYGNGPRIGTDAHGLEPVLSALSSALRLRFRLAKWPLATYIKQRYAGRLDLLIADEAHEQRGTTATRVCLRPPGACGQEGTVTDRHGVRRQGEYAVFSALPQHDRPQTDPDHRAVAAWVRQYGVLQEVVKTRLDANGKQTGNKRNRSMVRELPGASPALVRWLLDRSVFVVLKTSASPCPTMTNGWLVAMTPAMAERYGSLLDV